MILDALPKDKGFYSLTEIDHKHPELLLDFGVLKMDQGDNYINKEPKERAFLLFSGEVEFAWLDQKYVAKRSSVFEEGPTVLHLPENIEVEIRSLSDRAEIAVQSCFNDNSFPAKLYTPLDCGSEVFGKGTLNEASTRTVRTIFDGKIAPWSNMVMGEVIASPGKWSSYPPHSHPHPEIYHYKFYPSQGFGASFLDYEAHTVKDGQTCLIAPNKTHSQVAAAGYAMYYLWMIPHLPEEKWLPTTRYFKEEHKWLLDPNAKIWQEK